VWLALRQSIEKKTTPLTRFDPEDGSRTLSPKRWQHCQHPHSAKTEINVTKENVPK
jgi:hypothetical protein